jgi:hypothetical protein
MLTFVRRSGWVLLWLIFSSAAIAQQDGECTVNLDVAPLQQALNDILAEGDVLNEVADFGVAAPLMSASPAADGQITPGEYANTCFFSYADVENPGNPFPGLNTQVDGDEDLSLQLHLAHTDQYLFLGFEVTDEFLDLDEGVNAFTNDSIELFVNSDIVPDDFNPDTVGVLNNAEGWQMVADAAGEGDIEFNNRYSVATIIMIPADPASPPAEEEVATAGLTTDTGYVVEWQIPLATLDTESDDADTITPAQTGDVMLFNAVVNDNDELGAAGQDVHGMLWVVETDSTRSPFGGGENIWMVPLMLTDTAGITGDFDASGVLDAADIDALATQSAGGTNNATFDLTADALVNGADVSFWVKDLFNSWIGDADLDGEFNSSDLVTVLASGTYEANVDSVWTTGDFNGDGRTNSGDLVAALADGGYEVGPRPPGAAAVPEPASMLWLAMIALLIFLRPVLKPLV